MGNIVTISNPINESSKTNAFEGFCRRSGTSVFENDIDSFILCNSQNFEVPIGGCLVIDKVVSPECFGTG